MSFLTQGPKGEQVPYGGNKTNWKFLLIVIVLALIVGGGIFLLSGFKLEAPIILDEETTEKEIEIEKKATEEDFIDLFEVALPVQILRTTIFSEINSKDHSVGVLLEDYNGKKFAFSLDRRDSIDHYLVVGSEHFSKETAQKILYGSEEEKQLLKILESWDYFDWQPADQFDNTKAVILMLIRKLDHDFYARENIKIGKMNRVYQNKEFNFEFKFPENWFVFDGRFSYTGPRNIIVQLWRPEGFDMRGMDLAGGSPQKSMSVIVEKLSDYGVSSPDEFIELLIKKDPYSIDIPEEIDLSEENKIQISGRDAYVFIDRSGHTYYYYSAVFEKDDYLYQINFEFWEIKEITDIRREIISTFRFLE